MFELLWLIPALPLAGFVLLAIWGGRLPRPLVGLVGCGSVGASMALALWIGLRFLQSPPEDYFYRQVLWTWMEIGKLRPQIGLYLDPLSLLMVVVVTFVGFLIHVYSTEFMGGEEGFSRFFAYMDLFVASMLTLVLADDLLLLYLGWEGVGLCSYLLIGFWYKDSANGRAARTAFLVTRVGDTAMILGLFLIFHQLGTLAIQDAMQAAETAWPRDSAVAIAAAALLLGGALGKSAQLPLQTWLPDAMAGPTPVSALIHAATMVTAGVYLIARTHVLFALAPTVQTAVAVIGAATLLVAGLSALCQSDIKRVLAYSTISQIGHMSLALGVGAWSAAMFHFFTHAFFKALLFLAAGAVILAMHHEHNMFHMGGLWRRMPLVFVTFLIGAASLASLPLVTAGFYSKDWILREAWESQSGGPWLWAAGMAGALVTALYSFRIVFLTFFGPPQQEIAYRPRAAMLLPLVILAVLSAAAGFLEMPAPLGHQTWFSGFLQPVLSTSETQMPLRREIILMADAAAVSLLGMYLAWWFILRAPQYTEFLVRRPRAWLVYRFWRAGWGFDWLYDWLLVRPYAALARLGRGDVIDRIYRSIGWLAQRAHFGLSRTQTGRLRWYAAGLALGAAVLAAMVLLL